MKRKKNDKTFIESLFEKEELTEEDFIKLDKIWRQFLNWKLHNKNTTSKDNNLDNSIYVRSLDRMIKSHEYDNYVKSNYEYSDDMYDKYFNNYKIYPDWRIQ